MQAEKRTEETAREERMKPWNAVRTLSGKFGETIEESLVGEGRKFGLL